MLPSMRVYLASLLVAVIALIGCGTTNATPAGGDTPPPQAGHPVPPPLPSPTACHLDTDCTISVSAPIADNLCCDETVTAGPIATAYLQLVTQWRTTACAGVSCEPERLPGAQLAPCGYEPRCVAGTCTNACNQPPRAVTSPPPSPPS